MPLTPELIDAAVERYWRECDRYQKLAECIGEACQTLLRYSNVKLLQGTRYWPGVLRASIQAVNEVADSDRDGALGIVLFAASGSTLLELLKKTIKSGSSIARTRHYLLEELYERGWRLRFRDRRVEVLRVGREEPRTVTTTK